MRRMSLSVVDCVILLREHRLDARRLENFPAQRWGFTSITVIAMTLSSFKKRGQFIVGLTMNSLSVAAMCVNNPDCSPLGING